MWRASFPKLNLARAALVGVGRKRTEAVKRIQGGDRVIVSKNLTDAESRRIGGIRDLRGTEEARNRIRAVSIVTGYSLRDLVALEPDAVRKRPQPGWEGFIR